MTTKSKEELSGSVDISKEVLGDTRQSLSLLEKETRINFFKKASSWIKTLFGSSTTESNTGQINETTSSTSSKIDTSKLDSRGFTPGPYPFKHITTPYKGIKAYRVDNVKLNPLLSFNQLSLKGTEGSMTTLKVKDQNLHYVSTKTAGYKKNNPCNVSPFAGDVGRVSSSKVADGQNHSKYNSMEDGLASFMRLMRQNRYRNKSIQGINCSGMQGIYKTNEPDSLKALRVIWITRACNNLHISPFDRLNTDDKETMMAFTQQTAINESGSYFDRATLERAYKKAFG